VWVIDPSYLGRMYGASRDPRAAQLRATLARAIAAADLDDRFSFEIASGRFPRALEALDAIMASDYPSETSGAMYAYVCEIIVGVWGRAQPGDAFAPCGLELPDRVDAALESMGVTSFRVSMLTAGQLPLPIPRCDDFPGFGCLSNAQCRAASTELARARYEGEDDAVRAALDDVRGWLRSATRLKSTGLIAFFR
jgi:hypothetical protein